MKKILLLVTMVLLIAGTAFAAPIDPFNIRPVPVTIPSPDGAGKDLQTILNTMFGAGVVSATNGPFGVPPGQQTAGMWGISAWPYSTIPTMAFEYAGNAGINIFGIWSDSDMDDSTAPTLVNIFKGAAAPGTVAALSWDISTGTILTIGGDSTKVYTGDYTGINPLSFGFYLKVGVNGPIYYTVDSMNVNDEAHALAYRVSDTWAIAFEDKPFRNGDEDYNDMVVKVESIKPIPEPATMLLLGSGLIGLAGYARKRFKK